MKSLNEAMKNLQKSKIIKENNLKSKKSLKTESKFDKVQATLPLDNFHSMGIIVSDDGETVQYMYSNDENSIYESEIEYDEEGNPYFKDKNDNTWYLNEFMRTDYPKTIKEMKQDANEIATFELDWTNEDIANMENNQEKELTLIKNVENTLKTNKIGAKVEIVSIDGSDFGGWPIVKVTGPKEELAKNIGLYYLGDSENNIDYNEIYDTYLEGKELDVRTDYPKTIKEMKQDAKIKSFDNKHEHDYMLLGRLKQDCDYFLGNGNRAKKHLWAGNVDGQIAKMKELYNKLPKKPEWLSMKDIENYEKEMKQDTKADLNESYNKINKLKIVEEDDLKEDWDNNHKIKIGSKVYWVGVGNEISAEGEVIDFPVDGRMTIKWDDNEQNTYDVTHPNIILADNYDDSVNESENKIEERFSKSNGGHDIYCDVCGDCIYEEGPESDHFLNGEEYLGGHVCFNCIKNNDGYNKMKEIMKQNTKADLNESLEMNEDIKTKILDYLHKNNINNLMNYGSDEDAINGMNGISEMFKDILDILKIKYVNVSTVDGTSDGKYVTTIDFGNKTLDLDIRASEEKDNILEDVKTIIDFCNNKNENLTEDVGTMTPDEYILRETKKALLDRGLDIDLLHETCSEFGLAEYLRTTIHYILNGINFNVNEYVYGEDFDFSLDSKLNLTIDMTEDLDEAKKVEDETKGISPAERKILNAVKIVSSKYDLSNIKIETTRKGNTHIMSTKGEDIVTIGPLTDDEKEDLRLNGYYINN